jgi:hypothetical protein
MQTHAPSMLFQIFEHFCSAAKLRNTATRIPLATVIEMLAFTLCQPPAVAVANECSAI